jgi:hypothetical protein
MSITSRLNVRGGVENINANSDPVGNADPVETSIREKRSNPRRVLCKPIKLTTSVHIAP